MPVPNAARRPRERLASLNHPSPTRFSPTATTPPASASKSTQQKATKPGPCCNRPDIQEHDGTRVCLSCGIVFNESEIVSEVTFGETAAGAAVVQGAFVGENQRHANTMGGGLRGTGDGMGSREQTEYNGRDEIRKLAGALHLSSGIEEQAFGIYKLAINHNFIQGRRTRNVAAVCLYVACRRNRENTTLLMDFAEKLQVSVWKLGDLYKNLTRDLWFEEPGGSGAHTVLEVEPLVLKYARKLEFGEKTYQVATDAVKLIKRMKRDWMVQGRQPAGLCGACIILAARMNNFRRTVREVVYVVKVCDTTVFNRLIEFKRTQSSALTVDQFRKIGQRLKVQTLPPSVYQRAEREQKRKRKLEQLESASSTGRESGNTIETNLTSPASLAAPGDSTTPSAGANPDQISVGNGASSQGRRLDADGFLIPEPPISQSLLEASNIAHQEVVAQEYRETTLSATEQSPAKRRKKEKRAPIVISEEDLEIENELEEEIENILHDPEVWSNTNHPMYSQAEARAKVIANNMRGQTTVNDAEDVEEEEFADDPEVMNCQLSPEEVAIKERIWVTQNQDWLREQQAKLLKKALEEANGGPKKKTRRRKHSQMGDGSVLEGTVASTPEEAAQKMLEKRGKAFSSFINYETLQGIFNTADVRKQRESSSLSSGSPEAIEGTSTVSTTTASTRRRHADHPISVLPTPPTSQVTRPSQATSTRSGEQELETLVEEEEEVIEEEEEEEEEEDNPLGQLGIRSSDYYDDEDVGFEEEDYADDY